MRRTGNRTGGSNPSLSARRPGFRQVRRALPTVFEIGTRAAASGGRVALSVSALLAIESFKRTIVDARIWRLLCEAAMGATRKPHPRLLRQALQRLGKTIGLEETAAMT